MDQDFKLLENLVFPEINSCPRGFASRMGRVTKWTGKFCSLEAVWEIVEDLNRVLRNMKEGKEKRGRRKNKEK